MSALINADEIPEPLQPGACGAGLERPGKRARGEQPTVVAKCDLAFGHVTDHEEHDAAGQILSTWPRLYKPAPPRQLAQVAELVDGLNREVRALAEQVDELRTARDGPLRTPEGTRIPPLPLWLIRAAERTQDPGLALGFAGSAWVSAWNAAHELDATAGPT